MSTSRSVKPSASSWLMTSSCGAAAGPGWRASRPASRSAPSRCRSRGGAQPAERRRSRTPAGRRRRSCRAAGSSRAGRSRSARRRGPTTSTAIRMESWLRSTGRSGADPAHQLGGERLHHRPVVLGHLGGEEAGGRLALAAVLRALEVAGSAAAWAPGCGRRRSRPRPSGWRPARPRRRSRPAGCPRARAAPGGRRRTSGRPSARARRPGRAPAAGRPRVVGGLELADGAAERRRWCSRGPGSLRRPGRA